VKAPSPLLGFNNNVRHKGRVFHIQTEDSGVRHPHIITHLFADGGRILKTTKTSYAEHIGTSNMAETVRAMMQEQHKAMFIALRDGQFDALFEDSTSNAARAAKAAMAKAPPPETERPESQPLSQKAPPAPPPPPSEPVVQAAPPSVRRVSSRPRLDIDPATLHGLEVPPPSTSVTVASEGEGSTIDLDLDALERAAAEAQTPFFQQITDLPPPPAAVLGKKPATTGSVGSYSVTPQPARHHAHASPPAANAEPRGQPAQQASRDAHARDDERRRALRPLAPPRPSSRPRARRDGASIFGEDLISEKSLDEVILSYLAEDLEGPVEKK
jgi:hypothetical protein